MNEFSVNVKEFGAKGDGINKDTVYLQKAIDACSEKGGGTVLVPKGNYLTGTLFIKSHVTVYLSAGATLLGSRELRDYAENIIGCCFRKEFYLDKCLIYSENAENISFEGKGTIDGQGDAFALKIKNDERSAERPMLIRLANCRNVTIRDITLKNAAAWCTNLVSCDDVKIDGVAIRNRVNRNNDGFDLNNCQRVSVSNCNLSCSDDAFAFHNTSSERQCRDIVITNCIISSRWSAFRFNASKGDIRNITISNCAIYDTFGCAIKINISRSSVMENVVFSNLTMDNVTGPISLRFGNYAWNEGDPITPLGGIRNILFSNIRAKIASRHTLLETEYEMMQGEQKSCISIMGIPGDHIEGITFDNINVTYPGGGTLEEAKRREIPELEENYPDYFIFGILPAYGLYARHAGSITLNNVRFELNSADSRQSFMCDDVKDFRLFNFRSDGYEQTGSVVERHFYK